jgi:hypothetical protein
MFGCFLLVWRARFFSSTVHQAAFQNMLGLYAEPPVSAQFCRQLFASRCIFLGGLKNQNRTPPLSSHLDAHPQIAYITRVMFNSASSLMIIAIIISSSDSGQG